MEYQAPHQTTEWEDVLRKKGIIPELPKGPSKDEVDEVAREAAAELQKLDMESKTLDELDELEDDLEDDVMAAYRKKRLEEMMAKAKADKFGDVYEINKPQFMDAVTEASKSNWVVCHLYKDAIVACQVMAKALTALARRFRAVKFVKIIGDRCIEKYPDSAMPTLVIYHEGVMVKQIVGVEPFGGLKMNDQDLEWHLAQIGVLQTELTEPPRAAAFRAQVLRGKQRTMNEQSDDDLDDF
eukprot:TRINITY_DN6447_c0_g1_i1.p1 TRINITY_DN6447_c0_g1~~TRINITY_DN6447_c0_g1_i1.p1  ORF type:complete len:240 (-),score=59.82 TRINITY_DN6447_c0_g1_i1:634-1353(-)